MLVSFLLSISLKISTRRILIHNIGPPHILNTSVAYVCILWLWQEYISSIVHDLVYTRFKFWVPKPFHASKILIFENFLDWDSGCNEKLTLHPLSHKNFIQLAYVAHNIHRWLLTTPKCKLRKHAQNRHVIDSSSTLGSNSVSRQGLIGVYRPTSYHASWTF